MSISGVRKAYRWSVVYVLLALVVGGVVGGCLRKHKGTPPLQGELRDAEGAKLALISPFRRELGAVDSAAVHNGHFRFTNGTLRGVYAFSVEGVGEWLVYLSDVPTRIYFGDEIPLLAQPYGDTLNWMLRENHRLVRKLGARMQEFTQEYEASTVDGNKIARGKLEALDAMWRRVSEEFEGDVKRLVTSDLDNPVGIFLLRQYRDMFSPEELEDFRGVIEGYARATPEDANAAAMLEHLQRNANLLLGAKPPTIAGRLIHSGEQVWLDSLVCRGDEVLFQFWTLGDEQSDSCVQELTRFEKLYGTLGLQVVGLCFAPSREAASAYLMEHGVGWPNILVYGSISEQYGVWGGERNFLYGQDGRLVARDVSLEDLEARMEGNQ